MKLKNVEFDYTDGGTPIIHFHDKMSDEDIEYLKKWFEWRSRRTDVQRQLIFEEKDAKNKEA